mmetsp:Transcript_7486/g.27330  ORF Transcript_7486/g.27330 Transcript_7486/m.27330 type:complete len:228 (-) Transcript_7486:208-891(-)
MTRRSFNNFLDALTLGLALELLSLLAMNARVSASASASSMRARVSISASIASFNARILSARSMLSLRAASTACASSCRVNFQPSRAVSAPNTSLCVAPRASSSPFNKTSRHDDANASTRGSIAPAVPFPISATCPAIAATSPSVNPLSRLATNPSCLLIAICDPIPTPCSTASFTSLGSTTMAVTWDFGSDNNIFAKDFFSFASRFNADLFTRPMCTKGSSSMSYSS